MIRTRDRERVACDRDRPEFQAPERQRGAQRDAQEDHRERPDHVEDPRDHAVRPAPEVAGQEAEDDAHEDRAERRGDADQERVPAAVQQAHRDIPPAAVGAEEEFAPVGRPDRDAVEVDDAAPARRPSRRCRPRWAGRTGCGARRGLPRAARRCTSRPGPGTAPRTPSAVLLRRSRRPASCHGLAPWRPCSSAVSSSGTPIESSVPGSAAAASLAATRSDYPARVDCVGTRCRNERGRLAAPPPFSALTTRRP